MRVGPNQTHSSRCHPDLILFNLAIVGPPVLAGYAAWDPFKIAVLPQASTVWSRAAYVESYRGQEQLEAIAVQRPGKAILIFDSTGHALNSGG